MTRYRRVVAGSASTALLLLGVAGTPALAQTASPVRGGSACSAGARTLAPPGSHLYPDTGNGGYTSLHTDVHLVYNATSNRFLPGNHVTLTDRATQCLASFSLDFERHSVNATAGPDMTVTGVWVNGRRASFRFVQPTYSGDPKGQNDPSPLAHEASELNPVGGPHHNPLPPACSPELTSTKRAAKESKNGTQCPANKLVIRPGAPLRAGRTFQVTVAYTGRPGVHNDGDGTTEGWFRSNKPKGDGAFVTTEPAGTEDWMPLNDYPTAKPTYDFADTVNAGKTVLANGILQGTRRHQASGQFPHGSVTWYWHSAAPVASYLVEDSVGTFDLTKRMAGGRTFYQAQASSLSAARKAKNRVIMNKQAEITKFESKYTGPFPFTSDGVAVGRPSASFEEEMQTMITFAGGEIDTDTLYHENMHQWWGDHVSESGYEMTFFKEGMATLAEFLFAARTAQNKAGGAGSAAGRQAFRRSLVTTFNGLYRSKDGFWTVAPSNPTPWGLYSGSSTYDRPGIGYIALRQILGAARFTSALEQIQRQYGGRSITEPQLEAAFQRWLPDHSAACTSRLGQFFHQWWDTAYPRGGHANRPKITGPGLAGPQFYNSSCPQ
jgi:hypothetical protein